MRTFAAIHGALALALLTCPALGAEYEVIQKSNAFSVKTLKVKVGDAVSFKNEDPYFHNVFSLSDVQSFDLGSYPQGQAKKVTFSKEGKVEVECAIHPAMKMAVETAK